MNLPFTTEKFLQLFESYNLTIFPAQIFLNLLALIIILLAVKKNHSSNKIIGLSLSILWLWTGIVYHLVFFSRINPAAKYFALLFILQGIIFFIFAGFKEKLNFSFTKDLKSFTGGFFMLYALLIYPVLGFIFDHTYPNNPTFGAPCPTTIFTFGLLLWTSERTAVYFAIIPLLWSIVGVFAAIKLGVIEDFGLFISGVIGFLMIILLNRKPINAEALKNPSAVKS